jgi:hypothetical protein
MRGLVSKGCTPRAKGKACRPLDDWRGWHVGSLQSALATFEVTYTLLKAQTKSKYLLYFTYFIHEFCCASFKLFQSLAQKIA